MLGRGLHPTPAWALGSADAVWSMIGICRCHFRSYLLIDRLALQVYDLGQRLSGCGKVRQEATTMLRKTTCAIAGALLALSGLGLTQGASAHPAPKTITTTDAFVLHRSRIPVIAGQPDQIYVQHKSVSGPVKRDRGPVLFIHGATYPTEAAFDLQYKNYSYENFLAKAGFDVYGMDMEGYSKSTRPWPMEDPCNLSVTQQQLLIPAVLKNTCLPSYNQVLGTNQADWSAVNDVVDWIRMRSGSKTVDLVGWSLGGMRSGGFAARYPDKIGRMVLFAPAYSSTSPDRPPAEQPAGAPFAIQNHDQFMQRWNNEVSCPDQVDPRAQETVWQQSLASDDLASTWGEGFIRRPSVLGSGWNAKTAAKVTAPTLLITGDLDRTVPSTAVQSLYNDISSREKVYLQVHCASHFSFDETQYRTLQKATRSWLEAGSIDGRTVGAMTAADISH